MFHQRNTTVDGDLVKPKEEASNPTLYTREFTPSLTVPFVIFFSILKRSGVGFFGQIAQLPSRKHKHGFSKSGALVTRNIFWSSTVSSWERQGFWVLAILDDSGVNINPSPALWSVARCCSDGEKAWGCGEHDELKLLMEIGRYDLLLRYFQMSETPPN